MRRAPRLLIAFLVAWVLFTRALVPAGWMPSAGGGLFAIELCPGAAPMAMAAGHHQGDASHQAPAHKEQHDDQCAFAPVSTAAAHIDAPATIAPVATTSDPPPQARTAPFFATGPPALLPPATGPPTLA